MCDIRWICTFHQELLMCCIAEPRTLKLDLLFCSSFCKAGRRQRIPVSVKDISENSIMLESVPM